jgi:XTP/dITP diphosphohydrolase
MEDPNRCARFVCAIAIADSKSNILETFEGTCEGRIATTPRGSHGFGYDPVFIPVGYSESFGTLSANIKDKISHRARALQAASPFFDKLFGGTGG